METVRSRPPEQAEQKVVLSNVSWETYESLLADHADRSAPRFTYDRGTLEITVLSARHEKPNRLISLMVEMLAEEMDLNIGNLGSTTFRREDARRGFEPDSCFYIQNAERVRDKDEIDPTTDPPPDLIVEVDITSPSLRRFPIYAQFGVPEVWRYDGKRLEVLFLEGEEYRSAGESAALPGFTSEVLSKLVEEGKSLRRTAWLKKVREAARAL